MVKIRAFLSLNVSGEAALALKEIQDQLKTRFSSAGIKWGDPAKFHLTLRFLGDIDEEKIPDLETILERLKFDFEKITFTARGIGFFPNRRNPNVIFIELAEQGNNTEKLVGFIDRIIFNFGITPDKKFVPHITAGRFKHEKREKPDHAVEIDFKPFSIEFGSFCLMKSTLRQEGSEYTVLNEFYFNT